MPSASLAEWLITRFTDRNRAAAIIGDLTEARAEKGRAWFWLSCAGIVLRLAIRPVAGLILALYARDWVLGSCNYAVYSLALDSPHRASTLWEPTLDILTIIASSLCGALVYTFIRYGWRDKLAQLLLPIAACLSLLILFWWQPLALWSSIALTATLLIGCMFSQTGRRSTLSLLIVSASGLASLFMMLFLDYKYRHFIHPGPLGDVELRAHPSIEWIDLGLFVLSAWMLTAICSMVHRRFLEPKLPGDNTSSFA